jgi:HEAT repeat protein
MGHHPGAPVEPSPSQRVAAARRRADVAQAGRAGDEVGVRRGLEDDEPSVRAGALAALARMGRARRADAMRACCDEDALVRKAACELAPSLPGAPYSGLLADADPGVVEAAAFALGELGEPGAVPALAEVALHHSDALCRESAVAALGAIGDERGLPAVLAALGGPPALRRRAVVALAAFEGTAVEDSLRAALQDRDWQVRQAAAAVLGLNEADTEGGAEIGAAAEGGSETAAGTDVPAPSTQDGLGGAPSGVRLSDGETR